MAHTASSTSLASTQAPALTVEELRPNVAHLLTEDDTPVDNIFSEKQQRLLTEPLYASWHPVRSADDNTQANAETGSTTATTVPREFLAAANVGLYYGVHQDPVVPDVMLSLDVSAPTDWWEKHNRVYMVWEFGKTPEVVIEVVSNLVGNELGKKLDRYARMGIMYYVVFDPSAQYGSQLLRLYALRGSEYAETDEFDPEKFPLSLTVWQGVYEGCDSEWLRWQHYDGTLVPTGRERAEAERERAESERLRAETERERAQAAHERAESERLRAETERERAHIEREHAKAERERAEAAETATKAERERAEAAEQRAASAEEQMQQLRAQLRAMGVNPDE
jgi:hypothetical protein